MGWGAGRGEDGGVVRECMSVKCEHKSFTNQYVMAWGEGLGKVQILFVEHE